MAENDTPVDEDVEDATVRSPHAGTPKIENVPWLRQLVVAVKKNMLLVSRRPVQLALMCLCSVGSVLLAYMNSRNNEFKVDFGTVPLTQCGTVDPAYWKELEMQGYVAVPNSYNMHWTRGFPVTLMGTSKSCLFAPDALCVFCFLTMNLDLQHLGQCFIRFWSLLSCKSIFRRKCLES